jgi:two-component system response regulator NreC
VVKKRISLVIADSHSLFRRCLVSVLASAGQFQVAGEAEGFEDVLGSPALRQAEVLVLGLDHEGPTGGEMTRAILSHSPQVKLLLLGNDDSEDQILDYLQHGALGYLFRRQPLADLLQALEVVARGETACSPQVAHRLFSRLGDLGRQRRQNERLERLSLTPRELEILRLIAEGLSNRDIARRLFLSVHTVKNHVHKILDTLGVASRLAAVNLASAKGWLTNRRRGA